MKSYFFFFTLAVYTAAGAQPQDDVMIRAMQDELQRNMRELQLPNHQKPFFIQYSIADLRVHQVVGALGAIIRSGSLPSRTKTSVRILVGGYEFNDESLDNNLYSEPGNNEIVLPIENDYNGIRRSLWVTTDNVYKSAARQFKKNEETLRDLNKELKDLPHRSFARQAPLTLMQDFSPPPFKRAEWDEYVRTVSAIALSYPEIMNSNVVLSYSEGFTYTVNSEGTSIRVPKSLAVLQATVQLKASGGLFLYDTYTVYAKVPTEFPPAAKAANDFRKMIDDLLSTSTLPTLQEEYTGPVLVEGREVAEIFSRALFGNRESLILSNEIQNASGFRMETATTEGRIGRNVIDPAVSVSATSRTRKYGASDLLGAYDADTEGVVPPDNLILIEKGILKDLLNDRTITKPSQTSNGHADGAGVIDIRIDNPVPVATLRERLLARAREEGLDHAFIVRSTPGSGLQLVRIGIDGKEMVVRGGSLGDIALKTLRKIPGAGAGRMAFQITGAGNQLSSFIVPEVVLFQELSILPAESPRFDEEVWVENPIKKSN